MFDRRDFLKAIPLAAAAASACRRDPYRAADFSLPARSPVALLPAAGYDADLAGTIARGLEMLGASVRGLRVFLKPNIVEYEAGSVINTHPHVIAGVADAARRAGAREVVVGEGPGHRRDTEYLVTATGLSELMVKIFGEGVLSVSRKGFAAAAPGSSTQTVCAALGVTMICRE